MEAIVIYALASKKKSWLTCPSVWLSRASFEKDAVGSISSYADKFQCFLGLKFRNGEKCFGSSCLLLGVPSVSACPNYLRGGKGQGSYLPHECHSKSRVFY